MVEPALDVASGVSKVLRFRECIRHADIQGALDF
jgi:hypothetical protein